MKIPTHIRTEYYKDLCINYSVHITLYTVTIISSVVTLGESCVEIACQAMGRSVHSVHTHIHYISVEARHHIL